MNATEVGRLLAAAATIDPRMPGPDEDGFVVRLWTGMLAEVPADDAERAMSEYYCSSRYLSGRESITPGEIIQHWHAHRRPTPHERDGGSAATRREHPPPPMNPDRVHAGVDRAVRALAERRALHAGLDADDAAQSSQDLATARRSARSVPCRWTHCGAPVGAPCTGPSGKPLANRAAHPCREADAAQQLTLSPQETR